MSCGADAASTGRASDAESTSLSPPRYEPIERNPPNATATSVTPRPPEAVPVSA